MSADPATGGVPGHVGIVDFDGRGISAGRLNVNVIRIRYCVSTLEEKNEEYS